MKTSLNPGAYLCVFGGVFSCLKIVGTTFHNRGTGIRVQGQHFLRREHLPHDRGNILPNQTSPCKLGMFAQLCSNHGLKVFMS